VSHIVKLWRMLVEDKAGQPRTLFHGLNGSRRLQLDVWLDAYVHPIYDENQEFVLFQAGFHLLPTESEAFAYAERFRARSDKVICQVDVDQSAGTWLKPRSREKVILARRMRITSKQWFERQGLVVCRLRPLAIA